ncbi:MAG: hypothetical protein GY796_17035 [Chloroflexi bacterium]|nr:hypothetical protein [Chloroflexota bacterium]
MMKLKMILIGLGLLAILAVGRLAADNRLFSMDWWTVDGGGGSSSDAQFTLSGTVGQPDVGSEMRDGEFTVSGGFWFDTAVLGRTLYLPVITNQN